MVQGRSLGVKLAQVTEKLDNLQEEFLKVVAEDLIEKSPIWSGTYITSHSINGFSKGGQFTGNIENTYGEKTSVPSAYKAEARANLYNDIARLENDSSKIYINNNAPHAGIVEYGGFNTPAYAVLRTVANRMPIHLATAKNKVGLK